MNLATNRFLEYIIERCLIEECAEKLLAIINALSSIQLFHSMGKEKK